MFVVRTGLVCLSLGLLAIGCGDSSGDATGAEVPANAVAAVAGEPITQEEFDRALEIATLGEQRTAPLIASPVPPDPPRYTRCIAARRADGSPAARRMPDSYFKPQCEQDFARLRDQAMSQLLQAAQLEKLASDKGIVVTQKEVSAALAAQMKQAKLSRSILKKRLAQLGMTRQDFRSNLRVQLLSAKIAKDFGVDQAALQAAQARLREETTCRQGFIVPGACGN